MTKTKKIKQAGRFSARYGTKVKSAVRKIESLQRKKQKCPFCKKNQVKRLASGIWKCKKCNKKFASHAYYLKESL
jgi:large subunit ribosomal protein L37Ae